MPLPRKGRRGAATGAAARPQSASAARGPRRARATALNASRHAARRRAVQMGEHTRRRHVGGLRALRRDARLSACYVDEGAGPHACARGVIAQLPKAAPSERGTGATHLGSSANTGRVGERSAAVEVRHAFVCSTGSCHNTQRYATSATRPRVPPPPAGSALVSLIRVCARLPASCGRTNASKRAATAAAAATDVIARAARAAGRRRHRGVRAGA